MLDQWWPTFTGPSSMEAFSYVVEMAGGASSDGHKPILDIVPTGIHVRSPIFLGSKDDVEDVINSIAKYSK